MISLFDESEQERLSQVAPLAVRMRPQTLEDYVGQMHVITPGSWLHQAILQDTLSSILLYGPAGTGKTTLARVIAHHTRSDFVELSAVNATVKDVREAIARAKSNLLSRSKKSILFIDEIHRFSRSQQDALLHAVEDRIIVLIGATTENPYFEVNSALISRSRVIELYPLSQEDLLCVLRRALEREEGYGQTVQAPDEVLAQIALRSGGDARLALNTLESLVQYAQAQHQPQDKPLVLMMSDFEEAQGLPGLAYDKQGDMHYDVISAFIKSMRGSDPDAAVYWLARMVAGGEDPKFIARRIFIFASEDIGNADPQAISVASAAFHAASVIGYPECAINLSQAAVYMALAPKSNASYQALNRARAHLKSHGALPVPQALRDRHRPGSQDYEPYKYPHSYPDAMVEQRYLPGGIERGSFYEPTDRGWEGYRTERLDN